MSEGEKGMKKYNVAVVGATGVVGQEMISILEERKFPVNELIPLASERSAGKSIYFNEKNVRVKTLTAEAFDGVDYALFSAGSNISKEFAPKAVEKGAVVIDNTSFFRMHDEIPLAVPEVNPSAISQHKGIIANPNCSTAQMVMALKPIHDEAIIERLVISTYQSVSGAGKEAIIELETQARKNLVGHESKAEIFPYQIAFNVIPQIDVFMENGYTKEEIKMIEETKKILGDQNIQITATTVRVPVFVGHSEAVNIQTKKPISPERVRELLTAMPGVSVMDNPSKQDYPTPRELAGKDDVFVGRIRKDLSMENGIECWIVSDNLRKGAALNSVQIAEYLIGA